MSETHPARLLLALVNRRWDEAEALVAERPPDVARFCELCRECDVAGWVHALLETERRSALLPPEILDRLAAVRRKMQHDNLLLLARAEQALDLLHEAGVTPVVLKGLDLLHRVYDRFDARSIDDVDLLLPAERLRDAIAALERGGWSAPPEPQRTHYIRSSHHLPLISPGEFDVGFELHWNLVQERRFTVDPAGIIDRAIPLEITGRRVLRMDDTDLIAHLLVHHFTHYFDRRLKWAVDLDLLSRRQRPDWDAVVRRVRGWSAGVATGLALRHLRKTVPAVIPEAATARLPVAAWRRLLLAPLRSDHPLELFRDVRRRGVRLYIAAVALERPTRLPAWLLHRVRRDRRPTTHPLDTG